MLYRYLLFFSTPYENKGYSSIEWHIKHFKELKLWNETKRPLGISGRRVAFICRCALEAVDRENIRGDISKTDIDQSSSSWCFLFLLQSHRAHAAAKPDEDSWKEICLFYHRSTNPNTSFLVLSSPLYEGFTVHAVVRVDVCVGGGWFSGTGCSCANA